MKIIKQLIIGAALAAIGAAASAQVATGADTSVLTRAQVRAQTAAAVAAGQLVSAGEAERYPFRLTQATSTRSRAAVEAEAVAALAAGQIPYGEFSLVDPQRQPVTTEKTRVQVRAETLETRRLGLLTPAGEQALPQATLAQDEAIRAAGLRARAASATRLAVK